MKSYCLRGCHGLRGMLGDNALLGGFIPSRLCFGTRHAEWVLANRNGLDLYGYKIGVVVTFRLSTISRFSRPLGVTTEAKTAGGDSLESRSAAKASSVAQHRVVVRNPTKQIL